MSYKQAKNTESVFSELFILLCWALGEVSPGQVKTQVLEGQGADTAGLRRLMGLRAQAYRRSYPRKPVLKDFSSRAPEFSSRVQPPDGLVGIDGYGLDPNSYVWKLLDVSQFVDAAVHLGLAWVDGVEWKRHRLGERRWAHGFES